MPSYWSQKRAGIEADVAADLVGGLEEGLAFADGDDQSRGGEGEELAEPPDAGEVEGVEPCGPLGLELVEPAGDGQAVPVVDDVDEVAASRAGEMSLVDGEGGRAGRVDALLKGGWPSEAGSDWAGCWDICLDRPASLPRTGAADHAMRSRPRDPVGPGSHRAHPATAPAGTRDSTVPADSGRSTSERSVIR